jgi:macrolide-specific efflux system membrane fusion protein
VAAASWGLSRALTPSAAGAPVTRGTVIFVVSGSVTVSADSESQINCPQDGTISKSNLAAGQDVQEGELLVQLDPGDLPLKRAQDSDSLDDVEKSLADKLPSEILLQNMQIALGKEKQVIDGGFGQTAQYEADQRSVQAQEITAKQERSTLETKQKLLKKSLQVYDYQLSQFEIKAPYNGTITTVSAHPGDQLTKGAPIAGLISRTLRIEAQVDQDDIAAVEENEKADVHFFAYPDKTFTAKVKRVLPSSDKSTQRFTVLLDLVDPVINLVRAGLTGEVGFTAGKHVNVLCVPRRALFGNSVLVVSHGRVEIRQVNPGYKTLLQAEILPNSDPHSTVSEGEVVLTENLNHFRDGDHVRVNLPPDAGAK